MLGALISSILIILFKFEAVVSADDYTNNTAILRPSNHLPLAGWLIERLFRDEAGVLHTDGNFFESESQATLMQFHAIVPPMLAVAYVVLLWTLIVIQFSSLTILVAPIVVRHVWVGEGSSEPRR